MSRTVKWLHVKMLIVLSNGFTTDGKLIIVYCYQLLLVIFILPFILLLLNLFTCLLGNLYSVGLKEEVIYSVALRNNLINCYHYYMYYLLVETRRCVVLLFLPT